MAVFLNDSVAIAGCPKIVLIIDSAAVRDIRNDFPVAETIHHVPIGTEFNVRWRLLGDFRFLVCHVAAINDENVILCVHAYAAHLSDDPFSRQGFWPIGIDDESCTAGMCLRARTHSENGHKAYTKPNLSEETYSILHLSPSETESATCTALCIICVR